MWIAHAELAALRADLIEQRTRATVLSEQAATHRTQTAFLIARINQLEKERAIMVRHITKLEIPIPELAAVPAPALDQAAVLSAMGSALFEDMGDDAARQQGVTWNAAGTVEYRDDTTRAKG
jgi:hypothetical protein